jgi:hypothetical protein
MTQVSDVAPGPLVRTFFLSAYRYSFDIWYISLPTKIQIKFEFGSDPLIFDEVMALGLGKNHELLVFRLLTDIHLIFGTLLCHTNMQIKFEFGSDPLIFQEVMALGLRKIS